MKNLLIEILIAATAAGCAPIQDDRPDERIGDDAQVITGWHNLGGGECGCPPGKCPLERRNMTERKRIMMEAAR